MRRHVLMVILVGNAATGCLIGGGPEVGLRSTGHVAIGFDATCNLGAAGIEGGVSSPVHAPGATGYVAARGFVPATLDTADAEGLTVQHDFYLGQSLGFAGGEGHRGLYGATWPMYVAGARSCNDRGGRLLFTLQVGVRWIGSVGEVFVAPKANLFGPACFH